MTKIGMIGLGTVGQGVAKLIPEKITKALVKDKNKKRSVEGIFLVDGIDDLVNDSSLDVIVEVMGGYEPAREYILKALNAKKHVVTANKAVIAEHGAELISCARQNNVNIRFEAAVGGCIPVVNYILDNSKGIKGIEMIINGTTNYILCKMKQGVSYDVALAQAQKKGFAESDPSFDVEGKDSAQKLAILSSLILKKWVDWKTIPTKGITDMNLLDFDSAIRLEGELKLLASYDVSKQELRVKPTIVYDKKLFVADECNAVCIDSIYAGKVYFIGKGAGQLPTALAVVSDVHKINENVLDKYPV